MLFRSLISLYFHSLIQEAVAANGTSLCPLDVILERSEESRRGITLKDRKEHRHSDALFHSIDFKLKHIPRMLFNDDTIAYLNACRGYALGILIVYRLQIIAVKLGMLQKPTTLEAVKVDI